MINLITAIGNTYIYEKIKKKKNYSVITRDIQYKEGILEALNINKNIQLLLISTKILEEKYFIEKIREKFEEIEIIIFIDKDYELDIAYFNSKGIYKIYFNNKNGYDTCLKNFDDFKEDITEQVRNDMNDFKNEILKKQTKKTYKNKFFIYNKNENSIKKIIMISGTRGVRQKCFFKYIF